MEFKHILEAQQFDKKMLKELFTLADRMEELTRSGESDLLRGKILASLFYVPSNRTRFSFESAMTRLGGRVLSSDRAEAFSSELKGGSLEDTIIAMGYYADAIVLRHHQGGSAKRAAKVSSVPIINAGDGMAQHPTQALLDLYTIERELGGIDGVVIAFVGDLANSRSIRSLGYFLAKYSGIKVHFVAPPPLGMREDMVQYLSKNGVTFFENYGLEAAPGRSRPESGRFLRDPDSRGKLRGPPGRLRKIQKEFRHRQKSPESHEEELHHHAPLSAAERNLARRWTRICGPFTSNRSTTASASAWPCWPKS